MDIRRAVGAKAGIPSEKLDDLLRYRQNNRFTAREQAALEYAERITRDDQEMTDACMARLREHFSEAEVVELTFIVGFQTFASKFAKAFGLAHRDSPRGCSVAPRPGDSLRAALSLAATGACSTREPSSR